LGGIATETADEIHPAADRAVAQIAQHLRLSEGDVLVYSAQLARLPLLYFGFEEIVHVLHVVHKPLVSAILPLALECTPEAADMLLLMLGEGGERDGLDHSIGDGAAFATHSR
jgi:hypothetical protein